MRVRRRLAALCVVGVLPFVHCGKTPTDGGGGGGGAYLWRAPLQDVGTGWMGRPAILGSTVFVETTNTVLALDLSTGSKRWQTVVKQASVPAAANIVAAGTAVFIAEVGSVVSLDASSGAARWQYSPDAPSYGAQSAVDDRALYIGTRSHKVYALDLQTGQPLWTTDIGVDWPFLGIVTGIAVSGDTVYAGAVKRLTSAGDSSVSIVTALDRITGTILFQFQAQQASAASSVSSAPIVSGTLLLVSDLGGAFYAIDRFAQREIWRVTTQPGYAGPFASPAVQGSRVYVGANDTYAYAADLGSGNIIWRTTTSASIRESALCGQRVFVNNLGIFVLDAATGQIIRTLFDDDPNEIPSSGFAVASDRVVFSGVHGAYALACQ